MARECRKKGIMGRPGTENRKKMKRFTIALLMLAICITGCAQTKKTGCQNDRLMELVSEYSGKDGFEAIRIGSFGTSIMKGAVKVAAAAEDDCDARKAEKMMKGINKMAIVSYDSCNSRTRDSFNSRLEKILESSEMLMEMKDDSSSMKIYGSLAPNGNTIHDIIMYAPADCALICLFGSIPTDSIMEISGMFAANN